MPIVQIEVVPMEINTGVFCPHCTKNNKRAEIIANLESIAVNQCVPHGLVGHNQFIQKITRFCCSVCEKMFITLPQKPHVEKYILGQLLQKRIGSTADRTLRGVVQRLIAQGESAIPKKRP